MYGKLLDDSGAIQVCGKDIVVRNLWIWALDVFMHGGKRNIGRLVLGQLHS